jgi:hypothetical protein
VRSFAGIPGVEVLPFSLGAGPVRVEVGRAQHTPNTDAVQREWDRLCSANPRLFDGQLLAVVSIDAERNVIAARPDRFARLAVQPRVATGVRILSVTGVLTARDRSGREHVLLGRRGKGTRVYDAMWELGPSGGLSLPPPGVTSLDESAILSHLADELSEEIGLHWDESRDRAARGVGITRDHIASSDDVVFVLDVGSLEESHVAPANWEYAETLWLPTDSVEVWDARYEREIIPPTRALFRALGWVGWA